jgi:glycosyltransferase involved in cell wall biosynthesis
LRILFLTPQYPYPPHKGTTLRNYNLLTGLAAHHDIDLLSFAAEAAGSSPLDRLCRRRATVPPPRRPNWRRALDTAISPWPDMGLRLWSSAFRQQLAAWVQDGAYDVIQVEGLELARYALTLAPAFPHPADRGGSTTLIVLDDHNAEYVLQKRLAETERVARGWSAGAVYSAVQWRKLRHFEQRACQQADRVVCVSEADAIALRELPGIRSPYVVPNGVDTEFYRRDAITPLALPPHTLVFTGTMDFRPNVDAVLWFTQEVLPLIRQAVPDVHFYIVGQRPHTRLDVLRDQPAIVVTDAVEDTRPYITGAAVYVAPLLTGGGTRLKLLEALSLQAPVVSTSLGAEGFAVMAGREMLLANGAADFAQAVVALLANRAQAQALGAAGRAFAVQRYDWRYIVPQLEAVYAAP